MKIRLKISLSKSIVMLVLLSGIQGSRALAQQPEQSPESNETAVSATSISDTQTNYPAYTATKDVLIPIQKVQGSSTKIQVLHLKLGQDVTVLDVTHDAQAGDLVRLGIDVDRGDTTPSDVWVKANDLLAANLQEADIVTNDRDPLTEMKATVTLHSAAPKKASKRMTYCYRYVKQYLLQHKIVPVYLPGSSAYMASAELPKFGFHTTGRSAQSARIGDICVYKGGNENNGHIEIRRPQGWWYGYGFHGAVSTEDHRLVGCYAKH